MTFNQTKYKQPRIKEGNKTQLDSTLLLFLILLYASCGNKSPKLNNSNALIDTVKNFKIEGSNLVTANGVDKSTITITLINHDGNPIVGETPQFVATNTNNKNSYLPCSSTNESGISICELRSTYAESKELKIIYPDIKIGQKNVEFIPGTEFQIQFENTLPGSVAINQAFSENVILSIVDEYNNRIKNSDINVSISAYLDVNCSTLAPGILTVDANPIFINNAASYEFTGISYNSPGNIYIGATASSDIPIACSSMITVDGTLSYHLEFSQGPSSSAQAGVSFADQPVIEVRDQFGSLARNSVLTSQNITLTAYSDSSCSIPALGNLGGVSITSPTDGIANNFNVFHDEVEVIYLKATSPNITSTCSQSVSVGVGPASPLTSTINGTGPVAANNYHFANIYITLKDQYGHIISGGQAPTFIATNNNGFDSGNSYDACSIPDLDGVSHCQLRSFIPEIKTLEITGPISKTGDSVAFINPPDPSKTTIIGTTTTADGFSPSIITITMLDSASNPVIGLTPTFDATDTGSTNVYSSCSISDSLGVSSCAMLSTKAEIKTLNLIMPLALSGGFSNFQAGTPDPVYSTISGTSPVLADGISTSTISITLKDINNNFVSGITPSFDATDSNSGNTYGACSPTNNSGVSTCSLKSTHAETKTLRITNPFVKSDNVVIFNPGTLSKLIFVTQPAVTSEASTNFSRQPIIELQDNLGNVILTSSDSIILEPYLDSSCTTTPATGTLTSDQNPMNANGVDGRVSFTNLSYNLVEKIYLRATSGSIFGCSDQIDITPPTTPFSIIIEQSPGQIDPTEILPISFDVTFSRKINPTTFTISDIYQNGDSISPTWSISNLGDDIHFTIQALGTTSTGLSTFIPSLPANVIEDQYLNKNLPSISSDNSVTLLGGFNVSIEQKIGQIDPTNVLPIEWDIIFEKAIDPASFDSLDIKQNGSSIDVVWNIISLGDNKNFTLQAISTSSNGTLLNETIQPSIDPGKVQTLLGEKNLLSTSIDNEVIYDRLIPTVTISLPENINSQNYTSYVISGTCSENNEVVHIDVSGITDNPICTLGSFSTSPLDTTLLSDSQSITITADHNDSLGNQAIQDQFIVIKDIIPPSIISVEGPLSGNFTVASTLDFVVNFDKNVDLLNIPQIKLDIGGVTKYATYVSGSGTTSLFFKYTIEGGLVDLDGISSFSPIELNSGTIKDTAGNNASLTFSPPDTSGVNVIQSSSQLAFSIQPSDSIAGVSISPSIKVEIRDLANNLVDTATDDITLSFYSDPSNGQATLSGTLTATAAGGIATFSNISIDKAFSNYKLSATSGSLTPAISDIFTISSGSKSKLVFATGPSNSILMTNINPEILVQIQDNFGNLTNSTDTITLSLKSDPTNGAVTLGGTLSQAAVNGIATFSDIQLNKKGIGYTLDATSTGPISVTSSPFDVSGIPVSISYLAHPSNTLSEVIISPAIQVEILDAEGDRVTSATDLITLSFGKDASSGVAFLGGTLAQNAVNGVAIFDDINVDMEYADYSLIASANNLLSGESWPFDINPTPPNSLTLINPFSSPNLDTTPTIEVSSVSPGDIVKLFLDSSCLTQIASMYSTNTFVSLTTNNLSEGGYTFYANRTTSNGSVSDCSSSSLDYTVLNSFDQLDDFTTFGNWTNLISDNRDWSIISGQTPSNRVGPTNGLGAGLSYAYTEASGTNASDVFLLQSNILDGLTYDLAFSFDWNKRGTNMGDLYLEASSDGGSNWTTIWSHLGNDILNNGADIWRHEYIDICSLGFNTSNVVLRFKGIMPASGTIRESDMAIDELHINSSGCQQISPAEIDISGVLEDAQITAINESAFTLSGFCSDNNELVIFSGDISGTSTCLNNQWSKTFDFSFYPDGILKIIADHISSAGGANGSVSRNIIKDTVLIQLDSMSALGNWSNVTGDNGDWAINVGNTPSTGVGPSSDQSGTGGYVYTEASNPTSAGDIFNLVSNEISINTWKVQFSFDWNKRGDTMGDLYIDVSSDSGSTWTTEWSHTGVDVAKNGLDVWRQETLDLCTLGHNSGTILVRVRAVMPASGTIWNSDIGIDNLKFTNDSTCSLP